MQNRWLESDLKEIFYLFVHRYNLPLLVCFHVVVLPYHGGDVAGCRARRAGEYEHLSARACRTADVRAAAHLRGF